MAGYALDQLDHGDLAHPLVVHGGQVGYSPRVVTEGRHADRQAEDKPGRRRGEA